jgi:hypothetical protein
MATSSESSSSTKVRGENEVFSNVDSTTFSTPSAANVSHKDPERKAVGVTAHGVASLRGWETDKGEGSLIFDPYGHLLGGEPGTTWLMRGFDAKELVRDDFVIGIALRTKRIDELLLEAVNGGCQQVCVLGNSHALAKT